MNTQKLENIKQKYISLTELISKPEVIADNKEWTKLVKEHSTLEPVVNAYDRLKTVESELEQARILLETEQDEEMIELAKEEFELKKTEREDVENELKVLLLPVV